ncbi:unnamed protein product, partial [Didymodactylos carnosus]
ALLNSVSEIRRWLPSIVRDIDINLAQTIVPCYTDEKVSQIYDKVSKLEYEHKCYKRKLAQLELKEKYETENDKLFSLDISHRVANVTQAQPYKKKTIVAANSSLDEFLTKPFELPLLAKEEYRPTEKKMFIDIGVNDEPLDSTNNVLNTSTLVDYSDDTDDDN